jgi:LPS sulfotransferase NodH
MRNNLLPIIIKVFVIKSLLLKKKGGYYLRHFAITAGLISGQTDYVRYIILGRPRTGSNLLRSLLNSHSGIVAFGEIYRNKQEIGWDLPGYFLNKKALTLFKNDPVDFLKAEVFKEYPKGVSAVGFKLFYDHAQDDSRKHLWPFLKKQKELRIIHLKRKNILKSHLSYLKAIRSGSWFNSFGLKEDSSPIHLDYEDCLNTFERIRTLEKSFDDYFKHHQKIDVYYENLGLNRQSEMERIQSFLGVEDENIFPSVYKQSHQPLCGAIANYYILKEKFKGTPWEIFFED